MMTLTRAMTNDERRHFLRRLAFAATPALEEGLRDRSADAALTVLLDRRRIRQPRPPAVARGVWVNRALRYRDVADNVFEATRDAHAVIAREEIETLRRWWLRELIAGPAPLRENLVLFFHGVFGSNSDTVDVPHALYRRNALVRRRCLGTVADLLTALVLDPAMMVQIGMDEHRRLRVSDRPAKLILDHWTVGEGAYEPGDVDALSRALTGWELVAPPGFEPGRPLAPRAPRAARRTGLRRVFRPEEFDDGPKTILGRTEAFDARSAMQWLASHDATARRFSRLLMAYFGVDDADGVLERRLVSTYHATGGAIEALLRALVGSEAFWADRSRWALIKSPIHLVVGACRQLGLTNPPLADVSRWLVAAGQTLFDTPNDGEGGWPGQAAWVEPPARLTVRYHVAAAIGGRLPPLGFDGADTTDRGVAASVSPLTDSLGEITAEALVARLDPAPGVETAALTRQVPSLTTVEGRDELVRRVMMTPSYQLA